MNIIEEFFAYALNKKDNLYTIEDHTQDHNQCIKYVHERVLATVSLNFYQDFNIIDMKIENLESEKVTFFLHFDLKDLNHAKELLDEMLDSYIKEIYNREIKILLCCTSGITTSYFKEKLNKTCSLLNVHYHFDATSYQNIHQEAYKYDFILLAPQIGKELNKIREIYEEIPVLTIPSDLFAVCDTTAIIDLVKKERHRRWKVQEMEKFPTERMALKTIKNTLVVCIRIEAGKTHLYGGFYHLGNFTQEEDIFKKEYKENDIFDLLDVLLAKYPQAENISVCTPGSLDHGKITFHTAGIEDIDVQKIFKDKYHRNVYFTNDANAMAYGYYIFQNKHENIAFYFHPCFTQTRTGGMGYILDGKPRIGKSGLCGEMQYISPTLNIKNTNSFSTPEEAIEVLSKFMISAIANVDPDVIVYYCNLITDPEDLRKEIEKVIQPRFIPEIIKVNHCIGYMFLGGIARVALENHTL